MSFVLQEPYQTRPVRSLGTFSFEDWRVKLYTISYQNKPVRPGLVERARALLLPHLPAPSPATYGVAFIGVNQGRGADFVFIGWWSGENELNFHVYIAPEATPDTWTYGNPTGVIACVWDLAVIGFERQAWLDTVLMNPAGPDVDAYLACQLNGEV